MSFSSEIPEPREARWRELASRQLLGALSPGELAELESALREHREARDIYRIACGLDAGLRKMAAEDTPKRRGIVSARRAWPIAAAAVAMIGAFAWFAFKPDPVAAHLAETTNASWVSRPFQSGDDLQPGQQLELASGQAVIHFQSGAVTRLRGPAIFEIESANVGFLLAGRAWSRADTPESEGFTIHTRNAAFIDRGTEFHAHAGLDGHSQVDVTSGKVDVTISGRKSPHRLISGSSLGIEPGDVPILVRIEPGDETPAFRFPSIDPPSSNDFADLSRGEARASILAGELVVHSRNRLADSGPVEKLLDGRGQRNQDTPNDSVFFRDKTSGAFLIDLGQAIDVSRINSYTWHQNFTVPASRYRAVQRFTLWGHAGDNPATEIGSLAESGWVRIARVNSDAFFDVTDPLDRPAQQACSITAAEGSLGKFRYLLFDVQPTPTNSKRGLPNHTFYGEIDVFATPAENR